MHQIYKQNMFRFWCEKRSTFLSNLLHGQVLNDHRSRSECQTIETNRNDVSVTCVKNG